MKLVHRITLRGMWALVAAAVLAAAPSPRDHLAKRATELGFGAHAAQIARDALPGARLVAGGKDVVGGTRLGGAPDLPRAMKWPTCKGHRLSFLGQVSLADVAQAAPGAVPSRGVLAFFADLHPDSEGVPPVEVAYGRVGKPTCVVVRWLKGTLRTRSTPRHVETLKRRPVRLQPTLTVPDISIAEQRYGVKGSAAEEKWWRLAGKAVTGRLGGHAADPDYDAVHQVLGWPSPVQDTPLYGCGDHASKQPDYRLLFQLDYDDSLDFAIGDGMALYLSGKPADLRAGRFSKLCAEAQEG